MQHPAFSEAEFGVDVVETNAPRPLLIAILSVLHIASGGGILVMQLFLGRGLGDIAPILGTSPFMMQFSLLLLGALNLAAGIGMWKGTEWGWRVAAFCYAFAIYRNANAIYFLASHPELLADATRSAGYFPCGSGNCCP